MSTTPPDTPTDPGPEPAGHEGPRVSAEQMRDLGRLRRSTSDRHVAGVAGGLGRHLDVDPVILRVAFVVLAFFGGAGLLVYGACWLLVPEDDGSEPVVRMDDRSRTVALVIVGCVAALALVGDSWGVFGFPWPLALVAAVVLAVLTYRPSKRSREAAGPGAEQAAAYAPQHPAAEPAVDPQVAWVPPDSGTATYPQAAPRPRDPRKKGPVLFWSTAALALLGLGLLGLLDAAGVPVAPSAYPALVVATCGAMLVLGAFWGRAGGLIAVGLLATVAMAAATVGGELDGRRVHEVPLNAASVQGDYDLEVGELVVDLRQVSDMAALDGRTVELDLEAGRMEVLVPVDLEVVVDAAIEGPGNLEVFDEQRGGIGTSVSHREPAQGDSQGTLRIEADLSVGELVIDHTAGPDWSERFEERRNR